MTMEFFIKVIKKNTRYLKGRVFPPILKMLLMRLIVFYQKHISAHTCLYKPTCSQYTLECINNYGCILGCLMGAWRILRCNPLSKGGYDPVPEKPWQMKWLV